MKFGTYWSKVWVIRDSEGPGSILLPAGSKFWLEPMQGHGGIAYYCLPARQPRRDARVLRSERSPVILSMTCRTPF
jgi:hypothetical protein